MKKACKARRSHIFFKQNSYNSDCDTSIGGLSSDEEDDFDCQLENNYNLEDLR